MAGLKFTTDTDVATLPKLAARRAQEMGYRVVETGPQSLRLQRGNLLLSLVANPFATYCNFRLAIETFGKANEVALEWDTPWWMGMLGVSSTKKAATELMQRLREEVTGREWKEF